MKGFTRRSIIGLGGLLLAMSTAGCGGSGTSTTAPANDPASTPNLVSTPPHSLPSPSGAKPLMVPSKGNNGTPSADAEFVTPPLAAGAGPAETEVSYDATSLAAWNELLKPDLAPEAWEAARQTLLDRGAEAEPLLLKELASSEAYHRETAATLLAQTGVPSETAQKALVARLQDDSPFVRANAAAALAPIPELGEKVVPVLTKLLADEDPQLRRMAALNLSSFGVEAAPEVATLAAALDDKDQEVVLPVVQLLGRIGQKAEPAMPRLQQIVFEQEGEIRKAAETALEQIRTPAPSDKKD